MFTTTKGGLGRYRFLMGSGDKPDRVWDSGLRTDTGIMTLLPNPTLLVDLGVPVVDEGLLEWGGNTYVMAGTVLRRVTSAGVVQFYCTNDNVWETHPPTGPHPARALPGTGVSMSVYGGKIAFWCGASGFDTYNGTATWVHAAAPTGMYALTFDSQHVVVDTTGQLKSTTDLVTFANIGSARAIDCTPTALVVALDGARSPAIHLGTNRGLFVLDWAAAKLYPLQAAFPDGHADNCRGTRVWQGSLHYTKGGSVRSYQPAAGIAQVADLGPMTDDGLPAYKVGRVVCLEASLEHMLLAAVDAGAGGTSAVYLWRGGPHWHTLVEASATARSIRALSFTTTTTPSRLYYGEDTGLYWIPWFDTTSNPVQVPSGMTYKSTGKLTTAWFGAAEVRQLAIDLRLLARKITAGETASFEAAYDDDDAASAWVSVGALTRNGINTILFPNNAYPFRTVRLRITMNRGASSALTPWLPIGSLRWTALPKALYAYSFTIDASKPYQGLSPAEIEVALTAVTDAAVGDFSYRPDDPKGDRRVRVAEMRDASATGHDSRGKWVCTVKELVPVTETSTGMKWDGSGDWSGSFTWA